MEQKTTTENITLRDAVQAEREALQAYRGIIADDGPYIVPPTDDWKESRSARIVQTDKMLDQSIKATDALLDGYPSPWRYSAGRTLLDDEDVEITLHDRVLGEMIAWGKPSEMLAIHSHVFAQMAPKSLVMVARALLDEQGIDWESAYHREKVTQ
ncbi:hypothetical protein H7F10_10610 [Acidithiobacillus sp. HP-6]|uniref:hypothetical protein n=1 Tax=unclassified Acidithiobacillus TaxID=2614800 RepID=UPI001879A472|nr:MULTISPECIES: hypothetical protein [unclassified Acidithiobacillus]MBE7563389.1 hypothetical protein [Acidithiobacillus sp. HP-6]MBE7570917.1 hypothetical protein [Acidithiobacillus sp. HP-2]